MNQHSHFAHLRLKTTITLHGVGQPFTFYRQNTLPFQNDSKSKLLVVPKSADRVSVHNRILNLHRYLVCGDTYSYSVLQCAYPQVFQIVLTMFWIDVGCLAQKLMNAHSRLSLLDLSTIASSLGQFTTETAPKQRGCFGV